MAKKKLQRFAEMASFPNVFQPDVGLLCGEQFQLSGNWKSQYFMNNNPIVLELGCGKGEYTVGLARLNPNVNYIGVDIKGARIWRGAKTAVEENLKNVAFIRTKIEFIGDFFAENEIDEIWLTFSDPQPKKPRKRLSSHVFLSMYSKILINQGLVHLKTDNTELYQFTKDICITNNLEIIESTPDLYSTQGLDNVKAIKTHYEGIFSSQGIAIKYLSFKLEKRERYLQVI